MLNFVDLMSEETAERIFRGSTTALRIWRMLDFIDKVHCAS